MAFMEHLPDFIGQMRGQLGDAQGVGLAEWLPGRKVGKCQGARPQVNLHAFEQVTPGYALDSAAADDALMRGMVRILNLPLREQVGQFNAQRGDNLVNRTAAVAMNQDAAIVAFANR